MNIVIIDTGCANLSSVKYAIERLGYQPTITADKDLILKADKLFLPGVGTAKAAMESLDSRELIDLIKVCNQPILGICLGMQLLAKQSEEGNVETLNIINDTVKKIPDCDLPLPHMGWNQVMAKAGHHLFRNIPQDAYFYFVHSYAIPVCESTIAEVKYGERLTAAIEQDNYYGVQFHPERSGQAGAQLLKNFLEI